MDHITEQTIAPGWRQDPTGRHGLRYWDGTAWTVHVCSGGATSIDPLDPPSDVPPQPAPLPVPPAYAAVSPARRVDVRRIVWLTYAIPVTVLLIASSASLLPTRGPVAVFDLVFSMPLMAALFLHIWDTRTLGPLVWKGYAFTFLAWQLAYGFFIEPAMSGQPFSAGSLVGFALMLPMLVALFRYAFGSRRSAEQAASAEQTASPKRGLVAIGVAVGTLAVVSLLAVALPIAGRSLSVASRDARAYDVRVKPPATPPDLAWTRTSAKDRARVRSLLEAGDFDALDRAFSTWQAAAVKDPSVERLVWESFGVFDRTGDERRLNEWVEHSPSHFAPYLARAQYHYSMGWDARGTHWARETSREQFAGMEAAFEKAAADVDEALERDGQLPLAHALRLGICNAMGDEAAEQDAIDAAERAFPHSYVMYAHILNAQQPRWGGGYARMERTAEKAVRDNPKDPRFYGLFGLLYQDQADGLQREERPADAIEMYSKALAFGQGWDWLAERGWLYRSTRDMDSALKDADAAIALDPEHVSARILRATILLERGETEAALADFRVAAASDPDDPAVAWWKKRATSELGRVPQ